MIKLRKKAPYTCRTPGCHMTPLAADDGKHCKPCVAKQAQAQAKLLAPIERAPRQIRAALCRRCDKPGELDPHGRCALCAAKMPMWPSAEGPLLGYANMEHSAPELFKI